MGLRGRSAFQDGGRVFFVTTTVVDFGQVFACGEQYYCLLLDSLKHVLREHGAKLLAYVLMPSHTHLVIAMPSGENISDLMRDFKKFTSTKVRQLLEKDGNNYWLERLRWNASRISNQRFKLWMNRFDDLVIETEETLKVKIHYIHNNPVRAGLVEKPEDWKFSSARNYIVSKDNIIDIITDWTLLP